MSKRSLILNNARILGVGNAERLKQYSYAILLSDFMQKHIAVPHFPDRYPMYDEIIRHCDLKNAAVQYLEFGVYKGDSIRYWAGKNVNKASKFYGFDSFEGLPEDWYPGMEKGAFDMSGEVPVMKDERISFVKGWFNETLMKFLKGVRPDPDMKIVLHLDADLYSSTYYVLNCLYFDGWVLPDTIIIFDEVIAASIAHTEFRAFYDFVGAMGTDYKVLAIGKYEMGLEII